MKRMKKVTAFITKGCGAEAKLLCFRHPTAGVQLPAGTVDVDESPETAVLREVWEETGLQNVTIAGKLGEQCEKLPANLRYVLRTTKLFDTPAFDASGLEFILFRGSQIKHLRDYGSFAHVAYEEYDYNQEPPKLLIEYDGYVRRSSLTQQMIRHFYHLPTHSPTDATWTIRADGHLFQCFWVRLQPKPTLLIPPQQVWLDLNYALLLQSIM